MKVKEGHVLRVIGTFSSSACVCVRVDKFFPFICISLSLYFSIITLSGQFINHVLCC